MHSLKTGQQENCLKPNCTKYENMQGQLKEIKVFCEPHSHCAIDNIISKGHPSIIPRTPTTCNNITRCGLGIRNLLLFNQALLGKWLWRVWNRERSLVESCGGCQVW